MSSLPRIFARWLLAIAALAGFVAPALAADYTQGVASSGSSAVIWFKSSVNTTWVDVHYQLNGGAQQNLRMGYNAGNARYETQVNNVAAGNTLSYFFTYNNGNPAYDTPRFSATISGSTPPAPTGIACFYEHANYQGASFCADVDSSWVGTAWNDRISSVKVRSGYSVQLFDDINYGGRSVTLTADAPNLGNNSSFNDLASSFRIRQSGSTDLPEGNGVMTLKLVNGTNGAWQDQQIYWSIIGYDPVTKVLSYVDNTGRLVPASLAANDAPNRLTKNGQNYSNYFYKLNEMPWVSIPRIDSGRMFISLGSPMYIKINQAADGRLGFAGPDMNNPSDPNQDVNFEWIEFTVDQWGYHGNTTRVDQFGFPLKTRLLGRDGYDRTLGENASRAKIFADFEALAQPEFRGLVQRPYRIVAPAKSVFNRGQAYGNYFAPYVDQVWAYYASTDLVFTAEAGTFRGRVIGNDFVFSKNGGPQNLYIRGKPTTQEILEGSGRLASGSSDEKVVQAQITAAFNRHLLMRVDPSQWSNAATYYGAGPANYYSKFWHDHSIDGLAYGFCYDDVRNQSTLLEHPSPRGMFITVGW
ncbi:beta-1,3-glucanase family protein [Roseateles depolymerans]|uniref:Carbohydrate binding family 6 n=1 Tax=Roseateles depolymerans TaxID=76731 RepID=A0A0U3D1P1_9BURK|nr:beta-1,3-glucanase family protein [Roseateles depolymerans]ALV07526.1 Carbohydrate binding family 6 [Roseateles depolymerans]REG22258.1 peptidase inhibitor family I36 [Roseateles depolymerans]